MKKNKIPHFYEKKGKGWVAYYHAVRVDGKLKWTPLGTDRNAALRKWAELEQRDTPLETNTFSAVAGEYMVWAKGEVDAGRLAARTLEDRQDYLKQMEPVFGKHALESIEPRHVRLYLDKRSAKIVGKKEMRFLSVLWNWARERGITNKANPVAGVKMPEEKGRTIVVSSQDYWLVYEHGSQIVKDVLLLAARLGTRPQEVFELKWEKVRFTPGGATVDIWQNKIGQWRTVVGDRELADQLRALQDAQAANCIYVLGDSKGGGPLKITGKFRYAFDGARKAAAARAEELGVKFTSFELRDVRPMAGIEMLLSNGMDAARQLLGHSTERMTAHYTTKRIGMVSKAAGIKADKRSTPDADVVEADAEH